MGEIIMNKNHNTPFLLIETPRAGKWNHRHIVAPGVPQQAYLNIIEAARQKSEGDNFLAVGHDNKVKQIKDNRYAPELLVLAGIDTKRLSKNQKQVLQDLLASLLRSVDKLVTEDIDWNREGETDPVVREELAVWFDKQFKDVETIAWNPKLKRLSKKTMSTMTVILLILFGLGGYFGLKGSKKIEDPDVIAADHLIKVLSKEKSPIDKDAITKELKSLKLIEDQEGKIKISTDMQGTVLTSMVRTRVFPEEILGLFSSKEGNNINLENPQIVGDLIACKKAIINFADLQNTNTSYTPFITQDQANALKREIEKHRQNENKTYSDVFRTASKSLKESCDQDLAKNKPLKFLKDCYREFGEKNKDIEFWKDAESLLDSCGKAKL